LLGDSATQLVSKAIKKHGKSENIDFEIFESDYNQIDFQIFDTNSELYKQEPEFVYLFKSTQKLLYKFQDTPLKERTQFAEKYIEAVEDQIETIASNISTTIICNNFYEINDSVFGNFSSKNNNSFLFILRKINVLLAELAQGCPNLFIVDLCTLQNQLGQALFIDNRMEIMATMALSIDGTSALAGALVQIISAIKGSFKKCLILDLDNTLWGGVIGDDGMENIEIGELGLGTAFTNIQRWAKELKQRGIVLAICSKNTEAIAKEPFHQHPDMILKLDDIAVFVANWNTKVDNIHHIQKVLNIGFDSMVFIDDNPFERNMVRENIKGITVPELPEDPTEYLSYLQSLNLFETASLSKADSYRTKQYQNEAKRVEVKASFANENDFLASLDMKCKVEGANVFSIPRIAQLTQRSNQFNLRTKRYTDQQIIKMNESNEFEIFTFFLSDKFGDHGLVSLIILEKREASIFIDTWIMSCRVLRRGLEQFVLNQIITFASENKYSTIMGEYLPTNKNKLVENHFTEMGFTFENNIYKLEVESYKTKKSHIQH